MKNKISLVLLLSLLLNANTHSKIFVETEQLKAINPGEPRADIKSKKHIKRLSLRLHSELEQIEDPKERRAVKKLIKNMNRSCSSTLYRENATNTQQLNKSFKNTICIVAERLTSPHAIISIAIATTTCALNGILNSSIALQMIHELVSAYKWGIASKFSFYIISLISILSRS